MKIGILTYHRTINYGSFLQAYSLLNSVNKIEGFEVEIINYNHLTMEIKRYTDVFRKPKHLFLNIRKLILFNKYINQKLPLSSKSCFSNSVSRTSKFVEKQKYDFLIVGSDEVWKYTKDRGFPTVYWLREITGSIKISYAASLNKSQMLIEQLNESEKEYLQEAIQDFDFIGVRDELTKLQLLSLNNKLAIHDTLDPTFLYDNNPKVKKLLIERLYKKYGITHTQKMIGLMTSNAEVGKMIKELYGTEYLIVSFHTYNKYSDVFIHDLNPFEFAEIFSIFSLVLTSFFHGTIFSIKNKVPFISVETNKLYASYKSKILDLLEKARLEDNYIYLSFVEDRELLRKTIEKNINQKITDEYDYILSYGKNSFYSLEKYLTSHAKT